MPSSLFAAIIAVVTGIIAPLLAYFIPKWVADSAQSAADAAAEVQAKKVATDLNQKISDLESKVNLSIDDQRQAMALWVQAQESSNHPPSSQL